MGKLTFAANLSTMFTEFDFLKRFQEAKKAGFDHVEMQFPYDYDPKDLADAKSGLNCFLINSFCAEEMGTASLPGKEVQFLSDLHKITPYYNALNIKRVHIMAGLRSQDFSFEDQLTFYKENLNSAVCYLENQNIVGVIEPICPDVKQDYFLSSFEIAKEVIDYVDSDHLKLLLDVYHLHKISGNVMKNLEVYYPYAGHIQISQDPDRREPFYPGGHIDYAKVFDFLQEKNYSLPIGLEYFPSGATADSVEWIKNYK